MFFSCLYLNKYNYIVFNNEQIQRQSFQIVKHEIEDKMPEEGLSNTMTVIGLVNGMIGGIILIMPILALNTGLLLIAPVTIISAFFSYFSSSLCLRHLRNFGDLDQSILKHFGNKRRYKIFYDATIIISFFAILILYFGLMSDMWYGIIQETKLIPILNAFALFPIVYIMKKFHFGASLLAYGILSIVGYCIFLIWMWASAPKGENKVPLADPNFVLLVAALAQGFAIQTFFIPILKQNPRNHNYGKLLIATYAIGCIVYGFIGYSGAFDIVNLKFFGPEGSSPQQIGDFFGEKEWQVILLYIIYLVHLYSAFPEFLLISKKRFFSIFKWPESDDVTFKDVIYVATVIFVCLALKLISLSPQTIVQLNGSIVSFFFIYVIPIGLHLKCVYFTDQEQRHLQFEDQEVPDIKQKQIQLVDAVRMDEDQNNKDTNMKDRKETSIEAKVSQKLSNLITNENNENNVTDEANAKQKDVCCNIHFRSKAHEVCELIIMVIMVLFGLFTMGFTLYTLITKQK